MVMQEIARQGKLDLGGKLVVRVTPAPPEEKGPLQLSKVEAAAAKQPSDPSPEQESCPASGPIHRCFRSLPSAATLTWEDYQALLAAGVFRLKAQAA